MKKVTIVIPVYNVEDYIKRCLESIKKQTFKDYEVIVVDDAGEDDTEEQLLKLADGRIRYIKLNENGGPSKARNVGVSAAKGDVIAFHDSDDICHSNRLSIQYKYLKEHPEFNMVYSRYNMLLDKKLIGIHPTINTDLSTLEGDIYYYLLQENSVRCPTIMMYKSVFESVGSFDEKLRCVEDWDLVVRIAKDSRIGFVGEPTIDANISYTGVSSNSKNYYDARSKMIASEKDELERLGLLNKVLSEYFNVSEKSGYLEYAKLVLMRELMLVSGIGQV